MPRTQPDERLGQFGSARAYGPGQPQHLAGAQPQRDIVETFARQTVHAQHLGAGRNRPPPNGRVAGQDRVHGRQDRAVRHLDHGCCQRNAAVTQNGDAVGNRTDLGQLVADEHQATAFGTQLPHPSEQRRNLLWGKGTGGFVEDQDAGVAQKPSGDFDQLAVGDFKTAGRGVKVKPCTQLCQQRGDTGAAWLPGKAKGQIFEHRQGRKHLRFLRNEVKTSRLRRSRAAGQPLAGDADLALCRGDVARQAAHEGGFTCTVAAQEGMNFAGPDRQIRILARDTALHTLERALAGRYGLAEARVIPSLPGAPLGPRLGAAAAQLLDDRLEPGALLAAGWGETTAQALRYLGPTASAKNISLVSLTGGVRTYLDGLRGAGWSSPLHIVPAPLVVSDPATASALSAEPEVASLLGMALRADVKLIGIGGMTSAATAVAQGYIGPEMLEPLRRQGAVGDILCRIFDKDGQVLPLPMHDRVIGVTLQTMLTTPNVVAAAGGPDKVAAIRAALIGGVINTLITDADTATALTAED